MTDKITINATIIFTDFVSRRPAVFTDKAAERREIRFRSQKARKWSSDKTLLLISIDPKAPSRVIHSYTLIKVNWNTIQWEG